MSLNEATLSRQLGRAKEDLTACARALESGGISAADRRKNAKWRHLNATYNTIRNRLKAAEAIKTRDEDAAKRKVEKIAAAAAEKSEPKKGKQPKVAAKAGGGGKKEKSAEPKEKKKKEEKKKEA
ncbi:MAG TPA: hypothetical protein VG055_24745 [Planctomycetaceae bacterium]|jgi:hypothetical protein|nr:hypothetical protein [Planctomycetaceae bacterium]